MFWNRGPPGLGMVRTGINILGSALLIISYFIIICALREMDSCSAPFLESSREDLSDGKAIITGLCRKIKKRRT